MVFKGDKPLIQRSKIYSILYRWKSKVSQRYQVSLTALHTGKEQFGSSTMAAHLGDRGTVIFAYLMQSYLLLSDSDFNHHGTPEEIRRYVSAFRCSSPWVGSFIPIKTWNLPDRWLQEAKTATICSLVPLLQPSMTIPNREGNFFWNSSHHI